MKKFYLLPLILLASCSTSGPVNTSLDDSADISIVNNPQEFHSDLDELIKIRQELESRSDWSSFYYQALIQREDEIISSLEEVQSELNENGEITLESGRSYSFKIQSFCVHPGQYRPLIGDGFRVGQMKGDAEKWLPEILEKLSKFPLDQSKVQNLIWQLLTGARYDDLSSENQYILNLFFKNAFIKFGNGALNRLAEQVIRSIAPKDVLSHVDSSIDEFKELKGKARDLQDDFKNLEKAFSPISNRKKPIPVGWMRMKEGYLIKVTSNGYPETRIDVYVPDEGRSPQAKKILKLANLVALPATGQRLALSHKMNIPKRTANEEYCKKLSYFKPKDCHEITDRERETILKFADPANFSKARYASPPDRSKPIESETDCSRFTQQIYERAGMNYLYSSTATFQCLNVFNETDAANGKPGDLVLYNGHIGILSKTGKVISATRGGPKGRSRLKSDDPNFLPPITEQPFEEFGKGKILRWRCP